MIALVTVISGDAYRRYAHELFASANTFLRPQGGSELVALEGRPGWPDATLYRYHALLNWHCRYDHIFLCDADMRFASPVGDEILGRLVATQHPGFVRTRRDALPYERRDESVARVARDEGGTYYAGGFVGGERDAFLALAATVVKQIDADDQRGVTAVWHDESHLNRALIDNPPTKVLSPSYCYPDDDSGYLKAWPQRYRRKLVALDKSEEERGGR